MKTYLNKLQKKLKKTLFNFCPQSFKNPLIRSMMKINYELPVGIEFRIAKTKSEHEQAFHLLYDAYVESDLMKPNESKMRVSIYNAILTSYVLIIVKDEEVIGTVSIVRDSKIGVPSEKMIDLDLIRKPGLQLAEVSALAIKSEWRNKLLLHLVKYLWEVAVKNIGIDLLVITLKHSNKKDASHLYEAIFFYQKIENKIYENYAFANNNAVVGMFLDLENAANNVQKTYNKKAKHKNLYHLFFKYSYSEFKYPQLDYYSIINTSMNVDMIRYFCKEKFDLTANMSEKDYFALKSFYRDLDIPDVLNTPPHLLNVAELVHNRGWRMPTLLKGYMTDIAPISIINVSLTGFQVFMKNHLCRNGEIYKIKLCVGPFKESIVTGEVKWIDNDRVGFTLITFDSEWSHYMSFCQRQLALLKENIKANEEDEVSHSHIA
jgi:hypothetical protein